MFNKNEWRLKQSRRVYILQLRNKLSEQNDGNIRLNRKHINHKKVVFNEMLGGSVNNVIFWYLKSCIFVIQLSFDLNLQMLMFSEVYL